MSLPRLQTAKSHASPGQAAPLNATNCQCLALLQLNVEGITTAKLNVIEQIAIKNKATIVLLQETHTENKNFLGISWPVTPPTNIMA